MLWLFPNSELNFFFKRAIVEHKRTLVAKVVDIFKSCPVHDDICIGCINVRSLVHYNSFSTANAPKQGLGSIEKNSPLVIGGPSHCVIRTQPRLKTNVHET